MDEAANEIARRSRGTPRICNALLRRVRDFAQVKGNGTITPEIATISLQSLNIDKYGLDEIDNKILLTIIDKFRGGPVGVSTIATAIGEDSGTVEEVYEPFLIMEGFIKRTPRGRVATHCLPTTISDETHTKIILYNPDYSIKRYSIANVHNEQCNGVFLLIVPFRINTCKLFSTNSKPTHALLASKRRLIGLQKTPFKTLTNALLESN